MEIYWDRLVVVDVEDAADIEVSPIPLSAAVAREAGFAARTTGPLQRPHYDYDCRLPLWDTHHQDGFYTRFGPVLPLLARTDDAVAIIGPGEEVHLEFDAALIPLRAGWTRRFVLETRGWCKDRDLFTRDGDTVAPLPLSNQDTLGNRPERDLLHQQFNSRYRSGG